MAAFRRTSAVLVDGGPDEAREEGGHEGVEGRDELVDVKIRGRYSSLQAAARANEISASGLRDLLYKEYRDYLTEPTTLFLAKLLEMTVEDVKALVKQPPPPPTTGESQGDIPAVPSPDARQLTLADA